MIRQALVAVVVTATAGIAAGAVQERPRARRDGDDRARFREELGLSEDQQSQLRKLHLDSRKAAIRRQADARLARLALLEALQAPNLDEKEVQAKVKQLSDLHAAQLRARVDTQLAMRQVLTPEQREKMLARRAERPAVRGLKRRPRPRGGDDEGREPDALTRPDVR